MDSSLGRGFYEVYCSSKEIIHNKQKHLFCNMLDLLSNTTKSTPTAVIAKIIKPNDLVQFWVEDVLPLVFDKDNSIQGSATSALEQGLLTVDIANICNYTNWANVKNAIVKEYAIRLHELRDSRSQYWHRIWCVLMQLLDKEILKSASTINLFLSIVEQGFRSPDNSVRGEAFTCWHLLIKIFATHNQLSSPKRLKLVCIPLKSSQSKTPHVASVKLRIWWYLIMCLREHMEQNFESVVEPFLTFCFGSEIKGTLGIVHQYVNMQEPALTCLAAIVSSERDELLLRLLREHELEPCRRLPTINFNITEKYWRSILYAALEAINLIVENGGQNDLKQRLLNLLVVSSIKLIIKQDMASLYEYFCAGLMQMMSKSYRPILVITNVIAQEGLKFSRSITDFDNYGRTLQCLINLLTSGRHCVDSNKIHQCIGQISNLDAFSTSGLGWQAVTIIDEQLFKMQNDEGFENFEIKFLIWRHLSSEIVNSTRNNIFGSSIEDFAEVLISWSVWPLRMIAEFTGRRNSSIFDEHFYYLFQKLLQLSEHTSERSKHLSDVGKVLSSIFKCGYEWEIVINLLNVYADEVMKHDCGSFAKHYEQSLSIIGQVMEQNLLRKDIVKLLTILRSVLYNLKSPGPNSLLDSIKSTIKLAIQKSSKGAVDAKFFEEWKQSIINTLRSAMDKNTINQVMDLFKEDVYVIIPSVWSLKPEKLTDRQKERFAEKTSIPALYNDMSQSQDSLIKPWTPKKIVIAKEDQNEIVIENFNVYEKESNTEFTESFQQSTTINKQPNNELNLLASTSINNKNVKSLSSIAGEKFDCEYIPNKKQQLLETNGNKLKHAQDPDEEALMISETEHRLELESESHCNNVHNDNQEDCIDERIIELTNAPYGAQALKETSPKKESTKNTLLLSPPDRKLTNNNSSPKLRPKPPSHLTGRGAQLINMIRNKKADAQLPQTPMPKLFVSKNDSLDRTGSGMDTMRIDNTSTPLHSKDILTFSKRLPSPSASPSTSILKRNVRRDSLEDIGLDSPASKKKRVSFHDPPVSITKEYIKHNEENKTKPKRCLIMDKLQSSSDKAPEIKHALKRRSKLDSIIEIEKFSMQQSNKKQDKPTQSNISLQILDENGSCLDCDGENVLNSNNQAEEEVDISLAMSHNAFHLETQKYTFEELLEKYLESGKESKLKCYNTMAKIISKGMSGDRKIKENVLEALSENHSKDFLEHAIRENLASVVCDRLNLPSVIEYVCEKSKINTGCRANLFLQMPDIIKCCKQDAERIELLQSLLGSISLNDNDILDLINGMMFTRSVDKTSLAAEAAIDSSSNL